MMGRGEASFLDHLEALRQTIIACFMALAVLYPLAYYAAPFLLKGLVAWCVPAELGKLYYFGPMDVFRIKLEMSLIIALALDFPWSAYQIWKFLMPALYKEEQKILLGGILLSTILFVLGVAFSILVMLPAVMSFAGSFATGDLQPLLGLNNFITLAGWLMLAFGMMFQTPVAVLIAVRLGFTTRAGLKAKRVYVMTGILILSAILTPPDVLSQLMLAVPTWLLFEGGLCLAGWLEPKQDQPAFRESLY